MLVSCSPPSQPLLLPLPPSRANRRYQTGQTPVRSKYLPRTFEPNGYFASLLLRRLLKRTDSAARGTDHASCFWPASSSLLRHRRLTHGLVSRCQLFSSFSCYGVKGGAPALRFGGPRRGGRFCRGQGLRRRRRRRRLEGAGAARRAHQVGLDQPLPRRRQPCVQARRRRGRLGAGGDPRRLQPLQHGGPARHPQGHRRRRRRHRAAPPLRPVLLRRRRPRQLPEGRAPRRRRHVREARPRPPAWPGAGAGPGARARGRVPAGRELHWGPCRGAGAGHRGGWEDGCVCRDRCSAPRRRRRPRGPAGWVVGEVKAFCVRCWENMDSCLLLSTKGQGNDLLLLLLLLSVEEERIVCVGDDQS